jgi:hypothetical protein
MFLASWPHRDPHPVQRTSIGCDSHIMHFSLQLPFPEGHASGLVCPKSPRCHRRRCVSGCWARHDTSCFCTYDSSARCNKGCSDAGACSKDCTGQSLSERATISRKAPALQLGFFILLCTRTLGLGWWLLCKLAGGN